MNDPAATADVCGDQWDERFERIIRDSLPLLPDDEPLLPDTSLAKFGLGSLETLALMVAVEEGYSVTLPEQLLVFETFATPGALWGSIARLRDGQSA